MNKQPQSGNGQLRADQGLDFPLTNEDIAVMGPIAASIQNLQQALAQYVAVTFNKRHGTPREIIVEQFNLKERKVRIRSTSKIVVPTSPSVVKAKFAGVKKKN